MRRLHLIIAVLLVGPAFAQDPAPTDSGRADPAPATPREVLSHVLSQARESGVIERVLGDRYLFFRRDPTSAGVVTLSSELLAPADDPRGLRCRLNLYGLTGKLAGLELDASYEVGFDGAVTALEVLQTRWDATATASGALNEDSLMVVQVRAPGQGGVMERKIRWTDETLPFVVCLFLASFHDQGLPEALDFNMFEGEDLRLNHFKSRIEVKPIQGEFGERVAVSCHKQLKENAESYVLLFFTGERAGELAGIRIGDSVMDPVDPREVDRLKAMATAGPGRPGTTPAPLQPPPPATPEATPSPPGED